MILAPERLTSEQLLVLDDQKVKFLYEQYKLVSDRAPYECEVLLLTDIVENIFQGELKGFSLADSVEAFLETMIFHRSTPFKEQMRIAEESSAERMKNLSERQLRALQHLHTLLSRSSR